MTEKEAIEALKIAIAEVEWNYPIDYAVAFEVAIKALEEVQEYRALGTLEEVQEAAEKQKPKKPDYEGDGYADGQLVYDTWICPNCHKRYEVDYDDYACCPKCGQSIDWE